MRNISRTLDLSLKIFNLLTFIGGLLIFVSLSYDIIHVKQYYLGRGFLELQFAVCIIFLIDFFLRLYAASNPWKYFVSDFLFLLVAIPWLNILYWLNIDLSQSAYLIFKSAPLLRGFYGMLIVIRGITRSGIGDLMISYVFTVVGFTYFAALIFFSFEEGRNPHVTNFGDCLWWAWMNVTTVGANIFAVTAIGKILSVLLPSLGMMMFPIFTVYVIDRFKKVHASSKRDEKRIEGAAEAQRRRPQRNRQRAVSTTPSGTPEKPAAQP